MHTDRVQPGITATANEPLYLTRWKALTSSYQLCQFFLSKIWRRFASSQGMGDRKVVVETRDEEDYVVVSSQGVGIGPFVDNQDRVWGTVDNYFQSLGTFPYDAQVPCLLPDQTSLVIPRYWPRDFERRGYPDQWIFNGTAVSKDEASNSMIEKLVLLAHGDEHLLKVWMQHWNYRPKMALTNQVFKEFKDLFEQEPIFIFKKTLVTLDTERGIVTCILEGQIKNVNDNNGDIYSCGGGGVEFKATGTYDLKWNDINTNVSFTPNKVEFSPLLNPPRTPI